MLRRGHGDRRADLRGKVLLAIVLMFLLCGAQIAEGVAFAYRDFGGGEDKDGIGILAAIPATLASPGSQDPANSFLRWQQATITYSFTSSFLMSYGVKGETAVIAAFNTWNVAVQTILHPGIDIKEAMQIGDPTILGLDKRYDLQSVALHEIGHVLGSDHPDVASKFNHNTTKGFKDPPVVKNYNVDSSGNFVRDVLPAGAHPVLWSTIDSDFRRRALTDDDLFFAQFLYTDPSASNGALGGPMFGLGIPFTFAEAANNTGGNIVIDTAIFGDGRTLASDLDRVAQPCPPGASSWCTIMSAHIDFNVSQPPTWLLMSAGLLGLLSCIWRGRTRRARGRA